MLPINHNKGHYLLTEIIKYLYDLKLISNDILYIIQFLAKPSYSIHSVDQMFLGYYVYRLIGLKKNKHNFQKYLFFTMSE